MPLYLPRITSRWPTWALTSEQEKCFRCDRRFIVNPAGRRSGKTELRKFRLALMAINPKSPRWGRNRVTHNFAPRYACAAPTFNQARRIYWDDLKAMIPEHWLASRPSESEMKIQLVSGAEIYVCGMDKPERIEGTPWDGIILDEYGNMKAKAWPAHVRPALADRNGWCWLIGVPEGRNHYYDTYQRAISGVDLNWGGFTWKSSDVLPKEEIEAARRDLDELTYLQEYEASFVVFSGRAYYPWSEQNLMPLRYDPFQPLIIMLDFNVSPGVAAIGQEQAIGLQFEVTKNPRSGIETRERVTGTGIIGEVWIPRNSNTPAVCRKIVQDWGRHQGSVYVYGDATGGNRGTAKVQGSDWDLVTDEFRRAPWADRVHFMQKRANPPERSRLNAVNSRIRSSAGIIRLAVDPARAPHVAADFDGVRLLEGGSGEIDKAHDPMLTHLSDAVGYYVEQNFPVLGIMETVGDM